MLKLFVSALENRCLLLVFFATGLTGLNLKPEVLCFDGKLSFHDAQNLNHEPIRIKSYSEPALRAREREIIIFHRSLSPAGYSLVRVWIVSHKKVIKDRGY